MLTETSKAQGPRRSSTRRERLAARADRAGQCGSAARQDRCRRRRLRDGDGNTPILQGDEGGRKALLETQETKSYLGSAGDKRFTELLRPILLGEHAADERIAGCRRRAAAVRSASVSS